MRKNSVLLLFTKNVEKGKVKTRLASTVGDDKALEIYEQLLDYTISITDKLPFPKHVYYAWKIEGEDRWSKEGFEKKLQAEGDLGDKMKHAFQQSFDQGISKVIIIGTDCAEINEKDILEAEALLNDNDVVIGPALDGGYYLLAMRKMINCVFENKPWSTETLFDLTLEELQQKDISFALLKPKSDIDYEEDWMRPNYINGELTV
ncbi:hypothetical protein SAMN05216474_0910 [Lishizhenia tianjinensis]|uniref:Glycosyltransferase n=1 Tax=Lishizhenia tianjinensis TaxID=477690 RepID=A0A1I6YHT5_9FLAO|nr:TIGR04282 family arsenosugar biosynthesis glycosyltransferase [Lishizhenia tianjinensis]SFT50065.1 hypothetical protein SAMN05216474_0910 [Lishizhenia tianjinensis]